MRTYTKKQEELIKKLYPSTDTTKLAQKLGRSVLSVYHKAYAMGLKKTDEYFRTHVAGRLTKADSKGIQTRFKKGHVPANKGKKMPDEVYEKVNATMFKKGQVPHNTKHFGKPYLNVMVKKGQVDKTWYIQVDKRRLTYLTYLCKNAGIDMKGKKPRLKEGYDFSKPPTLDDITVITNKQNMLRNSICRFPEDVRLLITARAALTRQINKRHEKQRDNTDRCEAGSLQRN